MAMPNHAMSCFKLPIGVCKDIEKAVRNYWWRRNGGKKGVNWVAWDRLRKQKCNGGLGFKDFQCFNLSFLAKIGWRLIQNPDSLLVTVLRDNIIQGRLSRNGLWQRNLLGLERYPRSSEGVGQGH